MRQSSMAVSFAGVGTKNDCAGEYVAAIYKAGSLKHAEILSVI
jgi:hypothetical protein